MRTTLERTVERYRAGKSAVVRDEVAEETPIALIFHGVPHVVMLATPADLEDFAAGFCLTEGFVAGLDEIHSIEVKPVPDAVEVHLRIAPNRFSALLQRRRNLTGRTGCGLCGTESLDQVLQNAVTVGKGPRVSSEELHAALEELQTRQPINAVTGSVHAAAWGLPGRGLQLVREDVGRHNALDKVIGALVRGPWDASAGYMLVTSRASFEMVQKTAAAGVAFLAAVSAPTAFAIRHAERAQLTLVGFARRDQHVIYAHSERLITRNVSYESC